MEAQITKANFWKVTAEFWKPVELWVPVRHRLADKAYVRQSGAGREPKNARVVFEATVYVLRTGCQWKARPAERFCSASTIHARFMQWKKPVSSKCCEQDIYSRPTALKPTVWQASLL